MELNYIAHAKQIVMMTEVVDFHYQNGGLTRKQYLDCKAILSNPNFNNHSCKMLLDVAGFYI